jgi:CubicO group peptidase (beta-lactamase class C family)
MNPGLPRTGGPGLRRRRGRSSATSLGAAALVAALVGSLAVLGPARIATVATPASPPASIDGFVQGWMRNNRVPGLALAITRGSEVTHLRGYGMAAPDRPATPDTPFFVASLSKSFTAVAVLQLVEAGRVSLDAPVVRYVPEFTLADPAAARRITVRQLLNQTSGMADAGFPEMTLPQPGSIRSAVVALGDARLVSPPGTRFHYFNPNYAVLARLVEEVTGEPFAGYVQDHLFDPLAMTHSAAVVTSAEARAVAPDLAEGHIVAFGLPIARKELDGYLGGSGGVISTARDLANWMVMQVQDGRFAGRTVLGGPWLELTRTPPSGIPGSYAMGWTPDPGPPTVLQHSGVLSAYHAIQVVLPESGHGFVVLASSGHTLTSWADLQRGIVRYLTGEGMPKPGWGVGDLGVLLAALAFLIGAAGVAGLVHALSWVRRLRRRRWRRSLGLVWPLLPAAFALGTPSLADRFADRVFGWQQLLLTLPDVAAVLALAGIAGLVVSAARTVALAALRSPLPSGGRSRSPEHADR